ncbi:glucose import [Tritrichomonas musculus]|uniref:Glucose import n=1 Tax=Tritrichomonas musculus TaxID=1915356 RepID=A0ABR2KPY8_9EUKA
MGFDKNAASILIILSLPFQFNIITDSYTIMKDEIPKGWKTGRQLSYYEDYFAEKITYYVGMVAAICFAFLYYKVCKMRLIISLGFIFNAIIWLIYLAVSENRVYVFIIVRGLQGITLALFQMSHCVYQFHFANQDSLCFCGGLIVSAMFVGLFFLNLIFYCCNWRPAAVICAIQSLLFAGLIWLVPEIYIKPKSISNSKIFDKCNRRPLLALIVIMIFQQLSGIGILLGQLSRILSSVGLSLDHYLQLCLFTFVCVLSAFISALISDYVGVRFLWSFSAFGLVIGLLIYAITLKVDSMAWISTLGIFIYFLFYGLGEGPIPWYLCGTLFPEEVRIESSVITVIENFFFFPILQILWNNLNKSAGQFGSIIFSLAVCFLSIFISFLIPNSDKKKDEGINIL